MERALADAGIVFMFAPAMHPAMKHVGPVRRELGIPTVMNLVGPLANPARAGRQVLGVSDPKRLSLMAGALKSLGSVHALVVYGEPGMDEVSPIGQTRVIEIRDGKTTEWTIDPAKYGYPHVKPEDLSGGPPAENAAIIERVLTGNGPQGASAAVVLNAAAAIYVSGRMKNYGEAVEAAKEAVSSGAGVVALERLRMASKNQ
jgi:anthranilate phosphoribosyltransferase